jgi:hypothetical protein
MATEVFVFLATCFATVSHPATTDITLAINTLVANTATAGLITIVVIVFT